MNWKFNAIYARTKANFSLAAIVFLSWNGFTVRSTDIWLHTEWIRCALRLGKEVESQMHFGELTYS